MRCYVTVGTTKFDELIKAVICLPFLKVLHEKGYTQLLIQAGNSSVDESDLELLAEQCQVSVEWYRYKPNILSDINDCQLVISHAGAGSCLEIMHAKKPCIVVINDTLMGNHQIELADKLASLGHVKHTVPSKLVETLEAFDPSELQPYEPGDPKLLSKHVHELLGMIYSD